MIESSGLIDNSLRLGLGIKQVGLSIDIFREKNNYYQLTLSVWLFKIDFSFDMTIPKKGKQYRKLGYNFKYYSLKDAKKRNPEVFKRLKKMGVE